MNQKKKEQPYCLDLNFQKHRLLLRFLDDSSTNVLLQRAQIVADVRIAYMNVERNNVRTRAKHDKKMESNLIKRNQHATLANMNYDMGDIMYVN